MSFSEQQRRRLAALADVLIPAAEGHLSASGADVGGAGLNQVLATCPEIETGLREVLEKCGAVEEASAVAELRAKEPATFGVLAEFAAGAYFLNSDVLKSINYRGQTPRTIEERADYLQDGLLESVIQRGAIFRSTP